MKPLLSSFLLLAFSCSYGAELVENFSTAPADRGWKVFGAAELYSWDSNEHALHVTWNSSQTNSYFYYSLPFYLTRNDSFRFQADLIFHDIEFGTNPGKPYTFQLCFGFINTTNAFDPEFFRGSGINATHGPRNLVEFAYFPDSGFGTTVAPTIVTENNQLYFSSNHPLELTTEDAFRIELRYDAPSQTLFTTITRNGEPFGTGESNSILPLVFPSSAADIVLNAFAISSYSDAGQNPPQFAGSILAHATIENIQISWPDPPIINLDLAQGLNGETIVKFAGESGWVYTLESSPDLVSWTQLDETTSHSAGTIQFTDASATDHEFYRVLARRAIAR